MRRRPWTRPTDDSGGATGGGEEDENERTVGQPAKTTERGMIALLHCYGVRVRSTEPIITTAAATGVVPWSPKSPTIATASPTSHNPPADGRSRSDHSPRRGSLSVGQLNCGDCTEAGDETRRHTNSATRRRERPARRQRQGTRGLGTASWGAANWRSAPVTTLRRHPIRPTMHLLTHRFVQCSAGGTSGRPLAKSPGARLFQRPDALCPARASWIRAKTPSRVLGRDGAQ